MEKIFTFSTHFSRHMFDILYDFSDQNDTTKRSMKEVIHDIHFSDQLDISMKEVIHGLHFSDQLDT